METYSFINKVIIKNKQKLNFFSSFLLQKYSMINSIIVNKL